MTESADITSTFSIEQYQDVDKPEYRDTIDIPLVRATDETLKGLGHLVKDFDKEEVVMAQWPATGTRPICPGTGNQGKTTGGKFNHWWEGRLCKSLNEGIEWSEDGYVHAHLANGEDESKREHAVIRELTAHPDGSQVFTPTNKEPFITVLAPRGDDINKRLGEIKAFYFDGTAGITVNTNVWHLPLVPVGNKCSALTKQAATFACTLYDSVTENGKFIRFPLHI